MFLRDKKSFGRASKGTKGKECGGGQWGGGGIGRVSSICFHSRSSASGVEFPLHFPQPGHPIPAPGSSLLSPANPRGSACSDALVLNPGYAGTAPPGHSVPHGCGLRAAPVSPWPLLSALGSCTICGPQTHVFPCVGAWSALSLSCSSWRRGKNSLSVLELDLGLNPILPCSIPFVGPEQTPQAFRAFLLPSVKRSC